MLKLPAWNFLKAETSTADAIGEQLGELDRDYAKADAELSRLSSRRPAILLDTTAAADAKLSALDAEMTAARRVLEATSARRSALEVEWRQAEAAETTARLDRERRDRYAAATKAQTEGVRLLAEYDATAAALASKIRRLVEIEGEIEEANADLPDEYPPVASAEPFNGRQPTADLWPTIEVWAGPDGSHHGHAAPGAQAPFHGAKRVVTRGYASTPGSPGFPHQPLAGRVHLPAIDLNGAPHWPPPATAVRLSDDAKLFLFKNGIKP